MNKARCAFIVVCAVFALAATAVPASAATITVDQTCIESVTPEPGGGLVSGSFSGAPTSGYDPNSFVSAEDSEPQGPSNFWVHYGGQSVRIDAQGNGTFSFHLGADYGSQLPDTLWVTLRLTNGQWTPFATVEVPVCGRDDRDGDGVKDLVDNCPTVSNAGQANNDGDAQGDACDADDDNDGVNDGVDNCELTSNAGQANNDGDAQGDACDADDDNDGVNDAVDNCQLTSNASQENNDLDAQGDACDADDDNDGVNDGGDNCQFAANPGQLDDDQDGVGNACDGTFDSNDGKSSGGGWLDTADGKVNFSASAKRVDGVTAGNCVVTVNQTKIKCLTVDGYFQSTTTDRAVFVGTATQNGVTTRYRIELTDNGESGTSDHIEITTDAGFAAAGVIGDGNLQVHRGV